MKKIIAILIVFIALFVCACAVQASEVASGECGTNLTWVLTDDGTLTISGTGEMEDYYYSAPWWSIRNSIQTVIVGEGITTIGDYAFISTPLTSITLPSTLEKIGDRALHSTEITEIVFPASLVEIEDNAFYGCSKLTTVYVPSLAMWCNISFSNEFATPLYKASSLVIDGTKATNIVIPNGISEIKPYAFSNYKALESVVIPDTVTVVGTKAFQNCKNLSSVTMSKNATEFGDGVFYYCNSLYDQNDTIYYNNVLFGYNGNTTTYTVPEGTVEINGYAIAHGGLTGGPTTIVVPDSVKHIGKWAFAGSPTLASVDLGNGVVTIDDSAFDNDSNLVSITLPKTLTSIGDGAFNVCTGLKTAAYAGSREQFAKISVGTDNTALTDHLTYTLTTVASGECGDNVTWTLTDDGMLTISGTGAMTNYLEGCAPWFSSAALITDVTIGANVTTIGQNSFYKCDKIVSIDIPSSVSVICDDAFYGCSSLSAVVLPENLSKVSEGSFAGCSSLSDIVIPNNVTAIGDFAFCECSSLKSITLPDNLSKISSCLFSGCAALSGIELPETVDSIGSYAFSNCSSLGEIILPGSVLSIEEASFANCTSLQKIVIPKSITSIDSTAFYGCNALAEVRYFGTKEEWDSLEDTAALTDIADKIKYTYPVLASGTCGDNLTWVLTDDGTLTISGTGAMTQYSYNSVPWYSIRDAIQTVVIESGVTSIGQYAFEGCKSLTNITIPESVTSIGSSAFYGCKSLTSITLPEGVTSIGWYAFYYCTSLTSITIPEGVTSIGNYAFYGCTSLTNITIPKSVTSIGEYAFSDCKSLTSITLPEGVTSIGIRTFENCTSLTSLHIPEGVTSIGVYAFDNCSSLTSITVSEKSSMYCEKGNCLINKVTKTLIRGCNTSVIPDDGSVKSIGGSAFSGCKSLTSITIPEGVTSIGDYAFSGCISLTSITIPKSVTLIDYYAFYGCTSLTNITIPKSVTLIDDSVFYCCHSLTKAYYLGTEEDWGKVTVAGNNTCLTNHLIYHPEHVWDDGVVTKAPTSTTEGERTYTCECGATKVEAVDKVGLLKATLTTDLNPITVKNGDTVTYTFTPNDVSTVAVGMFYFKVSDNLELISSEVNGVKKQFPLTTFGENIGANCYLFYNATNSPLPLLKLTYKYIGTTCGEVTMKCTAYDLVAETCESISMKINDTYDAATLSETVHVFGEWEKFDENQHARSCGCGGTEYEDHEWDSGVVVTEETATAPGVMKYTCSVCGATRTEEFENKLVLKPNQNGIEIKTVEGKDYLFGFTEQKTADELKALFMGEKGEVVDKDGNALGENTFVGTGCRIRVLDTEGRAISDITVVITGDVDGNGTISSADALLTLRDSAGISRLGTVYTMAADTDGNSTTSSVDALRILRYAAKLTPSIK